VEEDLVEMGYMSGSHPRSLLRHGTLFSSLSLYLDPGRSVCLIYTILIGGRISHFSSPTAREEVAEGLCWGEVAAQDRPVLR
jgi:hypothetical protein